MTWPLSAGPNWDRQRSSVVLPTPEGPTMQTNSPGPAVNVTSRSTSVVPKLLRRCSTARMSRVAVLSMVMVFLSAPGQAVPGQDAVLDDTEEDVEEIADDA